MNKISFTGINNLYVGIKTDTRIGSYVDSQGEVKQGKKDYLTTKLRCNLTDDSSGNDLTEFKKALDKCNNSYQARSVAQTDLNNIDITIRRCEVQDDAETVSNSEINVNGIKILTSNRNILPLFSYLAKLTTKMQTLADTTEKQTHYLKLANDSIAEEALNFIDNMPPQT